MAEWESRAVSALGFDLDHPPMGAWCRVVGDEVTIGASHWCPLMCLCSGLVTLGFSYFMFPMWRQYSGGFEPVLFLWTLATVFLGASSLLYCAGHVEVTLAGATGAVFTGIGPIGYRRTFDPRGVMAVEYQIRQHDEHCSHRVLLLGTRSVSLGRLLPLRRIEFVTVALQSVLPLKS